MFNIDWGLDKISYLANVAGALVLVFTLGKLSDYSKEITVLEQALKDNRQTVLEMSSELERTNKTVLDLQTEREKLQAKKETVKTVIKEVVKNDKASKEWGEIDLPASIVDTLKRLRNGDD